MLDKMSDVSRIVDRLVKKGLVIRKICRSDKRLVDVIIHQQGLDLLERIDKVNDQMDDAFANLSSDEVAVLNDLLDKIRS